MGLAYKYHLSQKKHRDEDSRRNIHEAWLDDSTVDAWLHGRILGQLNPFLQLDAGCSWLTIGDSRFANETQYIIRRDPEADVTTSDISESLLAEALEKHLIQKYSVENCESLSFSDESFDYVLCKESYHHIPLPYLALYEMIRVARKAVIIIEPNDMMQGAEYYKKYIDLKNGYVSLTDILRAILRKLGLIPVLRKLRGIPVEVQRQDVMAEFEESGNFIYCISEREMEKVALGIGLPTVAFATQNFYTEEGVEFQPATPGSPCFSKIQAQIEQADATGTYNMLCAVLFRTTPDEQLRRGLKEQNFRVKDLPKNPYQPRD